MISLRSLAVCATVVAALGCEKEATFTEPLPDFAAIHFVNAVPDTMQQDFRVVDIVSNAGLFDANFRGTNMFYQGIESGARTLRVFLSSADPVIAQQVLQESALSLNTGSSYTYLHAGFARTGSSPARTAILIQDTPPVPSTSQIGFRIINVAAGLGPVDVWVRQRPVNATTADSLPDARTVANLAFGAASAYAVFGRDSVAADTSRIVFAAAGTKTVLASIAAPAGVAGTTTNEPIAGSRIAQSVITAVLVPRSVAGSTASNFTTPSVLYLVDRRPPRGAAP